MEEQNKDTRKQRKRKKKNIAHCSFYRSSLGMCMDVSSCFIEFMCQRELVWELILEFHHDVYFGWEYDSPIRFCERCERPFFSISGSLLYPSFRLFWMWLLSMLWCRVTITHFSISSPSSLRFTPLHLISFFSHFVWCLTWIQHPHFILAYSMCPFIYHHFSCGDL